MADSAGQYLGVTPPMSTALPTESETSAATALLEELRRQNTFESAEDTEKRRKVLDSLQNICDEFVKTVAREKEARNEQLIKNARGKIFAYGSFRLGVYGPGSDIDTLIVAPKYVNLDDYFRLFPPLLLKMAPEGAVTNFTAVPEAHVPIMKFEFLGISIDLIFSRLAVLKELPAQNFDLRDMNLLRGLDERELRALNGPRVSDEIMSLIPEHATFRRALRAIKLWAKRRAIYANIMGFPGGVAWAIMVARVCQLYPRAASSLVLLKFFALMMRWQWRVPVVLKQIEQGPLSAPVWDQQSIAGRAHIMPIITPAYPSMCATHRVTKSTKQVILDEFARAFEVTAAVMDGKKPWSALFSKHTFFTSDYKYYITVVSAATAPGAHGAWSGKVESEVRLLVTRLENHPSIKLARPYTEGFERKHVCTEAQVAEVLEGKLSYVVRDAEAEAAALALLTQKMEMESGEGNTSNASNVTSNATSKDANGNAINKLENETETETETDQPKTNGTKTGETKTTEPDSEMAESADFAGAAAAAAASSSSDAGSGSSPKAKPRSSAPVTILTTTHYIGLELHEGAKSLDLSYQVEDFKRTVYKRGDFDPETHHIQIAHVRRFDLPDDVFGPGEKKPQKKAASESAGKGKKRARPAEADDSQLATKRQQTTVATAS